MAYIALRNLDMPGGEIRRVGELVPEAKKWHDPAAWVRMGHIVWVPDGHEAQFREDLLADRYRHLATVTPHVTRPALAHAAQHLRASLGHNPLVPVGEPEPPAFDQPPLMPQAAPSLPDPSADAAAMAADLAAEAQDAEAVDEDLAADNDDAPGEPDTAGPASDAVDAEDPQKPKVARRRTAKAKGRRR